MRSSNSSAKGPRIRGWVISFILSFLSFYFSFPDKRRKGSLLFARWVLFLAVLNFPFFAHAEEAKGETIPEVVVTATKKETLEEDVSASVTVINRKDIESQVGSTVPDVLQNLAGVDLVTVGTPGDDTDLRIRGSDRDEVLVLLDGVPINNIREHRALFLGIIPLEIVERIEIVRGPQSILYGSDAVGGVVNIITRKGTKNIQVPISFEAGNLGTFRETIGISDSPGKAEYNFLLNRMDQAGQFDRDRFGGWSAHGNLTYHFTPKVQASVGIHYFHSDQELFYEFLSSFDPATGAVLAKINKDNDNEFHRDVVVGRADVKATINKRWSLEFLYGLFVDRDSTFNTPFGDVAPPPFTPGQQDFNGSGIEHTADLRNFFNLYESEKFSTDLTVGFEFQRERVKFDDNPNGAFFPMPGQPDSRENYAPYFLQNFRFWGDTLIVSGGARFDHNTTYGNEWSPRGSVLYKLKKTGTTFRASYGEGFHGPTILDFFNTVLQKELGLPFQAARLQSELSRSYEAGVEQKIGKWAEVDASFFYTQFHRLFDELQFMDHAHVAGVEVNVEIKPISRLRLGGNYTFLSAKNDADGSRLSDRPENRWNIFAEGKPFDALQLRLDLNYVGSRLIPNVISTDVGDIPLVFIDSNGVPEGGSIAAGLTEKGRTLGGYFKVDFAANYHIAKNRWHMKDWKVYGKVLNLLNAQYQEKFGFPAPGITFLLGTQATF
ncbi:MAG: TonB-dependent receptor [bacterium]